jgi:RNA polymerase sigma factor (sigma-70 family)
MFKHGLNSRLDRGRLALLRSVYGDAVCCALVGSNRPQICGSAMAVSFELLVDEALHRGAEGDPLSPLSDRLPAAGLALDKLYRAKRLGLLRFFARRADRQDANDLLHDAFVRLASADQDRAHPIEQPEAFLSQVARNLLRDRARAAFDRSIMTSKPIDDGVAPVTDMIAALEARDILNRLQNAMLRLKPKTREIFMAHRLDGATYAEIAERMGLSVKTVEWHMSNAMSHLHRARKGRR